jgi:hypothetical protein
MVVGHADALCMVDHLFRDTAKTLQQWSAKAVGNIKTQIAVSREVIFRLETIHDIYSIVFGG